jgi:hypothetical protein
VSSVQEHYEALLRQRSIPSALASSIIAYTGPCRLFGFTITNTKASAQFVQLFDAAAVPADNAVPLFSKSVPATDAVGVYWGSVGRWMTQGVVLCNSSTSALKTIGSADCLFDVQVL